MSGACMPCDVTYFEAEARCSEPRSQPTVRCGWSSEDHQAGWGVCRVQDAHERRDHCLLADDGQDLFTDTSMVLRMIGMCEWLWGSVNGLS
jgi:hypothetical protein